MLIYIFLYMIGQQLNMGTTYWVLFWVCLTARIVIARPFSLHGQPDGMHLFANWAKGAFFWHGRPRQSKVNQDAVWIHRHRMV